MTAILFNTLLLTTLCFTFKVDCGWFQSCPKVNTVRTTNFRQVKLFLDYFHNDKRAI